MLRTVPLAEIDRRLEERLAGVREAKVNGNYLSFDDFVNTQLPGRYFSDHDESDIHVIATASEVFNEQLTHLMAFQGIESPDLGYILTLGGKIQTGLWKATVALKKWQKEAWAPGEEKLYEIGCEVTDKPKAWQFIKKSGLAKMKERNQARTGIMHDLMCFEPYANAQLAMQMYGEEMQRFQEERRFTQVPFGQFSKTNPMRREFPGIDPQKVMMVGANFLRQARAVYDVGHEHAFIFAEGEVPYSI